MRKKVILGFMLMLSILSFGNVSIKNMKNELLIIGISDENIDKANDVLAGALKKHRITLIELDQKELEINKLLIDDPEKNWFRINSLFDEIGQLNANLKKNQLRTQIEVRKYIPKQEYLKAKELHLEKLKSK